MQHSIQKKKEEFMVGARPTNKKIHIARPRSEQASAKLLRKHRAYIDELASRLGIESQKDWYTLKKCKLDSNRRATEIKKYHGGSWSQTLQVLYPELDWKQFSWKKEPQRFWNAQNRREYLEDLKTKLNITKNEDWYKISSRQILKHPKGSSVIGKGHSLHKMLLEAYPEVDWDATNFSKVPQRFWDSNENLRKYVEWISKQLKVEKHSDWYKINKKDFLRFPHGHSIISQYGKGHLSEFLQRVYPEMEWIPWKWKKLSSRIWEQPQLVHRWIKDMEATFKIEHPYQWLNFSRYRLSRLSGARSLIAFHGYSVINVLEAVYPQENWKVVAKRMSEIESRVHFCLKMIFPSIEIIPFQRFAFGELDFYIPSLSLGFEVQGKQHYQNTIFTMAVELQIQRDNIKKLKCEEYGITLIDIGYWWDGSVDSLISKIQQARADIEIRYSPQNYQMVLEAT